MISSVISYRVTFILLTLSVFGPLTASAQTYDAYAIADSITIGERFEVVVSVDHDGSRNPLFPHNFLPDSLANRPAFELGGLTFLGNSSPGRSEIRSGWVRDSLRYEVATFELDSAYVATFPIGLASQTDTLVAGTPGVLVWVKSLVPEDAAGIRDITDLADFPGFPLFWYLIPLLLLVIGYLVWRRFRRPDEIELEPGRFEPVEPPWDEAKRRLYVLERMDLGNPANIKPYYVELSEILRTYLARRAHVPALETTTRELILKLHEAISSGGVPPEIIDELDTLLSQADLVKFADMRPSNEYGKDALTRTRSAIAGTEEKFAALEAAEEESEPEDELLTSDIENAESVR